MNKISAIVILLVVVFLTCSCGGVVGNINKYSFEGTPPLLLKDALYRVYEKYPGLIKTDTTLYGNNNDEEFYYVFSGREEKIVFECKVIPPVPPYDSTTELSLTTAAVWGEIMKLAPEMGSSERKKFRELFEQIILPKIKEMLDNPRPIILNEPAEKQD